MDRHEHIVTPRRYIAWCGVLWCRRELANTIVTADWELRDEVNKALDAFMRHSADEHVRDALNMRDMLLVPREA